MEINKELIKEYVTEMETYDNLSGEQLLEKIKEVEAILNDFLLYQESK